LKKKITIYQLTTSINQQHTMEEKSLSSSLSSSPPSSSPPPLFSVKTILDNGDLIGKNVRIQGSVMTYRKQKQICFVKINDTSTLKDMQVVAATDLCPHDIFVHSSVEVEGLLLKSLGKGQDVEIQATKLTILGDTSEHDPATYPMSKTKLTLLHLRQYPHLRIRTKTMQSVMRIRSELSFATHAFFHQKRIRQVYTPLMTASDCEGFGETFSVATNYKEPFFKNGPKILTVSGQLDLETYVPGMGNVYTFGPCFRAEKSNTCRHLAEFWMIEAELIVQKGIDELVDFAEEYVRYCVKYVLDNCQEELQFLETHQAPGLVAQLQLYEKPFMRVQYKDAIQSQGIPFGTDLSSDQEKALMASLHDPPKPTFVMRYPKKIKAFYMKPSVNDEETVESFDLLAPGVQELIGGSVRENDLKALKQTMTQRHMDLTQYDQYLALRRVGSRKTGGFGMGFERLVMICTGMDNVRDVIPFPVCFEG